jgi:hypothetical protein
MCGPQRRSAGFAVTRGFDEDPPLSASSRFMPIQPSTLHGPPPNATSERRPPPIARFFMNWISCVWRRAASAIVQ